MADIPRLSFDKNLPDELQIVRAPQGLPFLPSAEAAPATEIVRKSNEIITAQAGNVNFPLRASEDGLVGPRGGLGQSSTEAARQQRGGKKS